MRKTALGMMLLVALLLSACKTKPPAPPEEPQAPPAAVAPVVEAPKPPEAPPPAPVAPEPSALKALAGGFWPGSPEARFKSMEFSLAFGSPQAVKTWRVDIASGGGKAARTIAGTGADKPATLSWDGKRDDGSAAPEGSYAATLAVDYGEAFTAGSAASSSFVLSLAPPVAALKLSPARLEPVPGGLRAPLSLAMEGKAGLARIESWKLDLLDSSGSALRSWFGAWPPAGPLAWDGKTASGGLAEPGSQYSAVLELRDEYGHSGRATAAVPVAALPVSPDKPSIKARAAGLSPNGDGFMDSIEFELGFGPAAVAGTWKAEILDSGGKAIKTFSGAGPKLPASLAWDGAAEGGATAPDGRYAARLSVEYGRDFAPGVSPNAAFALAAKAPAARLVVEPALFSPDGDGVGDKAVFRIEVATGPSRPDTWSIDIRDFEDLSFANFVGAWPNSSITWDGITKDGDLIDSAADYRVVAKVRDEFGNTATVEGRLSTDIIALKTPKGYRINISGIVFKGYTTDYTDVPVERSRQNERILDSLAENFKKFPGYKIHLVGHAVMIYWDNPLMGRAEQRAILLPLSKQRADVIAAALVKRGIEASRLSTEGIGSKDPLVPDSDLANRWKNRRVEFYLERP